MPYTDFEASVSCVGFPQSTSIGAYKWDRSISNGVYPEAHSEDRIRKGMNETTSVIMKRQSLFYKAIEVEGEKNAVVRCQEIIAEGEQSLLFCNFFFFKSDAFWGGCELDANYLGPTLSSENGKYYMTQTFIQAMIDWFKDGKTLPKRYVWEIVLGAHEQFAKEQSLVDLDIKEGATCDVIGDVHGWFIFTCRCDLLLIFE